MNLRATAFLAAACLTAAIGAVSGRAQAGPDTDPNQRPEASEPETPAAAPSAPPTAPAKTRKQAKETAPADASGATGVGPADTRPGLVQGAPASDAPAAEALSGAAMVLALRQGGYTLVVRHANSPLEAPDKASADPANDKLERQLDPIGRQAAKMLGVSIRALDIPIGELLSSPAYRARQTMILAGFGEPITEPELDEGGQGMQGAADEKSVAWLRTMVARPPRRGTNRLIVTHVPLIQAAFGKDAANIAPTETLILKPDGEGGATFVSRLKIEDLRALAGK